MGSWNETCGISQMPIMYGDDIRVFILAKQESYRSGGGGYCYADDCWTPYGLSIQGKYADYGSVDKVKNTYASKLFLKKIKESIDHTPPAAEDYRSYDLSDKKLSWNTIVSAISSQEMKNKEDKLGLMLVHEDIFQSLKSTNRICSSRGMEGYLYEPLSQIIDNDIVPFFNNLKGFAAEKKEILDGMKKFKSESNETKNEILQLKMARWQFTSMVDIDHNSVIGYAITGDKSRQLNYIKSELIALIDQGKDLNDKNIQTVFEELKDHICFCRAMDYLRKGWMPTFGKGSQDSDFDVHIKLAAAITNHANKYIKECNDEGGYYSEYELSDYQKEHNEKELKKRKLIAFS